MSAESIDAATRNKGMSGSRPFIVVGDKTDHGGKVLEGSPKALINDKMIARMGDKVSCPRCAGTHTIAEGDPRVMVDGKPAAFHGGKVSCGAVLTASMMDNTIGG
jgi:uncharacterized Zn-binding protein involved in type VI secretion